MNEIREWISDNKSRFASLIVAFINLFLGLMALGPFGMFYMFLLGTITLSFIWFGEYLGKSKVAFFVIRETPGWAMVFIGWILLVMPSVLVGVGFIISVLAK